MDKVHNTGGGLDEGRVTFDRRPNLLPFDKARPAPAEEQGTSEPATSEPAGSYQLTETEAGVLAWALENYLPELRYELARIKLERDRHELVRKEEMLSALLTRLSGPAQR